mmetsp:Transcript_19128/g.47926  ORF Transcript_19128/g.47926 Transcript_19128/m.47926 type:complete len:269 (-) Transcript_19128:189-995(-)
MSSSSTSARASQNQVACCMDFQRNATSSQVMHPKHEPKHPVAKESVPKISRESDVSFQRSGKSCICATYSEALWKTRVVHQWPKGASKHLITWTSNEHVGRKHCCYSRQRHCCHQPRRRRRQCPLRAARRCRNRRLGSKLGFADAEELCGGKARAAGLLGISETWLRPPFLTRHQCHLATRERDVLVRAIECHPVLGVIGAFEEAHAIIISITIDTRTALVDGTDKAGAANGALSASIRRFWGCGAAVLFHAIIPRSTALGFSVVPLV